MGNKNTKPQVDQTEQRIDVHHAEDKMKFYSLDSCPFCQRVWIAIEEKKLWDVIEYIEVPIELQNNDITKEFHKVSTMGKLPFIDDNGKHIYESIEIIEYLEEKYPNNDPKLIPSDIYKKWQTRLIIKEEISNFVDSFFAFLKCNEDTFESSKEKFVESLQKIECKLGGKFLMGDTFSILDVALYPFIEKSNILISHFKKYDFLKEYPKINSWYESLSSRPSIKATTTERSERSISLHVYDPSLKRDEYIRESFYPLVIGKTQQSREALEKMEDRKIAQEDFYQMMDNL